MRLGENSHLNETRDSPEAQYVQIQGWPSFTVSLGLEAHAVELMRKIYGDGNIRFPTATCAASPALHAVGMSITPTTERHWRAFLLNFVGREVPPSDSKSVIVEHVADLCRHKSLGPFFTQARDAFVHLATVIKNVWADNILQGVTDSPDDPLIQWSKSRKRNFKDAQEALFKSKPSKAAPVKKSASTPKAKGSAAPKKAKAKTPGVADLTLPLLRGILKSFGITGFSTHNKRTCCDKVGEMMRIGVPPVHTSASVKKHVKNCLIEQSAKNR